MSDAPLDTNLPQEQPYESDVAEPSELAPIREMRMDLGGMEVIWREYSPDEVGVRLMVLEDTFTGVKLNLKAPRDKFDTASYIAWLITRHSRSPEHTVEIARELVEKGVDPDGKIQMFLGIGHTSPADLAKVAISIDRLPMHAAWAIHDENATNDAQEKSTRFQGEFEGARLSPLHVYLPPEVMTRPQFAELEHAYQMLGAQALAGYKKYTAVIRDELTDYFKPEAGSKKQAAALEARVLDASRGRLLFGQETGLGYMTSGRKWAEMIGAFKANPSPFYQRLANLLELVLAPTEEVVEEMEYIPDAPGLVRHTKPFTLNQTNLRNLDDFLSQTDFFNDLEMENWGLKEQNVSYVPKEYSAGHRLAAQYILALYPAQDPFKVLEKLGELPLEVKKKISEIMFAGADNIYQMPDMARTGEMTFLFNTSIAINRDLLRHRGGGGRFSPYPGLYELPINYQKMKEILALGYILPVHLTAVPTLQETATDFQAELENYYKSLFVFLEDCHNALGDEIDYSFMTNLLPLAHKMPLWMHVNPRQVAYLKLRVKEGGQIDYRMLTYYAINQAAAADEFMHGARIDENAMPDPLSVEQFFSRN